MGPTAHFVMREVATRLPRLRRNRSTRCRRKVVQDAAAGRDLGADTNLHDQMGEVMERQRPEYPPIGSFIQITSLTRSRISQPILRRWPQ
jgi:hypothetical protein